MTAAMEQLLTAIEALPVDDRELLVLEILHRYPLGEGELSDEGLVEIADELFQSYDAAESSDAAPSS